MTDEIVEIDLDDPRFRIKPYQQMVASCTGALVTSVFGKYFFNFTRVLSEFFNISVISLLMP